MNDIGIGLYVAMGIGIVVSVVLAFYVLKFIKFTIKFLLSKNKK